MQAFQRMYRLRSLSPGLIRAVDGGRILHRTRSSPLDVLPLSSFPNRQFHKSVDYHSGNGCGSNRSTSHESSRARHAILWGTVASSTAFVSWNLASRPLHADAAAQVTREGVTSTLPKYPVSKQDMQITLYQYDVCPFCNKVRAYLDFHKIPYSVVEVDPMGKKELGEFPKDYRKVPIAVVNGVQVNGSSAIIDAVDLCVNGEKDDTSTPVARREKEWLAWVDDHLIHLISPNIYRSPTESLQAFEYIVDNAKFTAWQRMSIRYSGALAMYMVGKKIKKKYNIDEPRAAMYEAINKWTDAVEADGGAFLGGTDTPSTADLAVFGVLRAIKNFDTFNDIKSNCVAFEAWFNRTQEAVGDTAIVQRS